MTISFATTGPTVTHTRIDEVLGTSLPSEYRDFLLSQNGGVVDGSAHLPGDTTGASVRAFLSIDAEDGTYDLSGCLNTYEDRYPQGFLPIAVDASSNLILLDTGYEEPGTIWFWDHEGEADEDEPPRTDNIVKIAKAFRAFFENLTTGFTPEEDALIAEMVANGTARKGPFLPPGGFTVDDKN